MVEVYNICRTQYMQFIKNAYELMEKEPLMLDDTFDKVAIRLEEE